MRLTPETYQPLFEDDFGRIPDFDYIARLTFIVGSAIPNDYAEFLKSYPVTGLCYNYEKDEDLFVKGAELSDVVTSGEYPITTIFAYSQSLSHDLISIHESRGYGRDNSIIIAGTGGSSSFIMRLSDEHFGKIFYLSWDLEKLPLIASSFTEFVDRIRSD